MPILFVGLAVAILRREVYLFLIGVVVDPVHLVVLAELGEVVVRDDADILFVGGCSVGIKRGG